MTTKEFFEEMAMRNNLPKGKSTMYGKAFMNTLAECLMELEIGECITFYGFGTFKRKKIPPRKIGDLKNGGTKMTQGSSKVVFKLSEAWQ